MAQSLNEIVDHLLSEAVDKAVLPGEEVQYGFSFNVVVGEGGQPIIATVIVLRMRSLVIGEWLVTSAPLETPTPTEQMAERLLAEMVKQLRAARDDQAKHILVTSTHPHESGMSPSLELPNL